MQLAAAFPLSLFLAAGAAPGIVAEPRFQDVQDAALRVPEPAPYRVIRTEQFVATGAEPVFWVAGVVCDLWRLSDEDGSIQFDFLLRELEVVMGQERLQRWIVTEGANHLILAHDPESREIRSPIGQTYINGLLDELGSGHPAQEWTATVPIFDETLVPRIAATSVDVDFLVQPLSIKGQDRLLLTFESREVSVAVGDDLVHVTYDGFVLLDSRRELVYQALFRQRGDVSGETEFIHQACISLTDQFGEPLVGVDQHRILEEVADRYEFYPRPTVEVLFPAIQAETPKPEWATGTWLSGCFATAVIGLVADQTPLPAMTLGGVVLTDQSIQLAGNLYRYDLDIREGRRPPNAIFEPWVGNFPSPLAHAYVGPTTLIADAAPGREVSAREASAGTGPAGEAEGEDDDSLAPVLVPASASGVVQIGDQIMPFGGVTAAGALLLIANAGKPTLAFATGSNPVSASTLPGMTSPVPVVVAWSPLLFGLAGAAGAAAVSGGNGDGSDEDPPQGSFSGTWQVVCFDELPHNGSIVFTIQDGVLTGALAGGRPGQIFGQVSDSGEVKAKVGLATLNGTITQNGDSQSGSGILITPTCTGTWSVTGIRDR